MMDWDFTIEQGQLADLIREFGRDYLLVDPKVVIDPITGTATETSASEITVTGVLLPVTTGPHAETLGGQAHAVLTVAAPLDLPTARAPELRDGPTTYRVLLTEEANPGGQQLFVRLFLRRAV